MLNNRIDAALEPSRETRAILPFEDVAAEQYADVLVVREQVGPPIHTADAQIAAICRAHGATCATRNTRDFAQKGIELFDPRGAWVPRVLAVAPRRENTPCCLTRDLCFSLTAAESGILEDMSLVMSNQIAAVRERILRLRYPTIRPESMEVTEEAGPDGEEVVIAVRFAGSDGKEGWNADDFRAIRRDSRNIAVEEFSPLTAVRMVYNSDSSIADEQPSHAPGDKRPAGKDT